VCGVNEGVVIKGARIRV